MNNRLNNCPIIPLIDQENISYTSSQSIGQLIVWGCYNLSIHDLAILPAGKLSVVRSSNLSLVNNSGDMFLFRSSNNLIAKNQGHIRLVRYCSNNIITKNHIQSNNTMFYTDGFTGISLFDNCTANRIHDNEIHNVGWGLSLYMVSNNVIYRNSITQCYMAVGITFSSFNNFTANTFQGRQFSVYIAEESSTNNSFISNELSPSITISE